MEAKHLIKFNKSTCLKKLNLQATTIIIIRELNEQKTEEEIKFDEYQGVSRMDQKVGCL